MLNLYALYCHWDLCWQYLVSVPDHHKAAIEYTTIEDIIEAQFV